MGSCFGTSFLKLLLLADGLFTSEDDSTLKMMKKMDGGFENIRKGVILGKRTGRFKGPNEIWKGNIKFIMNNLEEG